MSNCPRCKSEGIHRSRIRTKWERWRKEITGKQQDRCHQCGWRGWGVDLGPRFGDEEAELAARALAPDPPNLKGTALAQNEQPAAVDLEKLDTLESPFVKDK